MVPRWCCAGTKSAAVNYGELRGELAVDLIALKLLTANLLTKWAYRISLKERFAVRGGLQKSPPYLTTEEAASGQQ